MDCAIIPMAEEHRQAVIDIFNFYVENSFAAFPEQKLPYPMFDMLLSMSRNYPSGVIQNQDGKVVGFGMLRAHNPMPAFLHTAEVSYFIDPAHTGNGIGKRLLDHLEERGRAQGIMSLLACISSKNPGSITFHARNGFVECGRFKAVAKKKGVSFDTVWMQKMLSGP